MLPKLSLLTRSEFPTSQRPFWRSIPCKNVESFLSSVLLGETDPKERTRRVRFHQRLLRNMLSVFLTPCESDAKSYGCDIFHPRTRVIWYRVSTALAYTFAGPLSLKQNGFFHISHYIGLHRLAHCALTPPESTRTMNMTCGDPRSDSEFQAGRWCARCLWVQGPTPSL